MVFQWSTSLFGGARNATDLPVVTALPTTMDTSVNMLSNNIPPQDGPRDS